MLTIEDVANAIRRELRGKLPDDTSLDEGTYLEDLALSSLQIAEIVFTLEEENGVEFDTARAANMKTLGDLVTLANEAIGAGSHPH
jgi:acyl carrier protein